MDKTASILFVDDEPNVLSAVKRVFMDDDYRILTACSGGEGLRVLEKEYVQVVISDYRMPDMNGVEFLQEVCKNWPGTIRIVLSGYADIAAIVAAINEGQIYKFIPKPWNHDELKITISNALERFSLLQKNQELANQLQKKNDELTRLNIDLETLLEEKTTNLAFRSKVVTTYQNILDSMLVGIIGVDESDTVTLCNKTWLQLTGSTWSLLGEAVTGHLPDSIKELIDEVKVRGTLRKRIDVHGVKGIVSGVKMKSESEQNGIICVFTREDDVS